MRWTLESASRAGFVHLLDLLAAQEWSGVSSTFRRLRCRHAVGEAADKGQLDVLQWWLSSNYGGCQLRGAYDTIFELVIARGHYAMLDWLNHQDKIPVGNARSKGVPCDDPDIVQWLHEEGHKVPLIVKLCYADTEEDLTYIKWVLKHKRAFKRIDGWAWAGFNAAYQGNFKIVKWLHANRPTDFTIGVLKGAISGGNLKIAQWANARKVYKYNTGVSFDHRPFKSLTKPMMEWLMSESQWPSNEERGYWINVTIRNAIKLGDLEAVKFMYGFQEYEPGRDMITETAAEMGRLDMLQWLHDQGAVCDRYSDGSCAIGGQLQVFKWLHEQGTLTPSADVVSKALRSNHPDLVQYILEHEDLHGLLGTETELQDGFGMHSNSGPAIVRSNNGFDISNLTPEDALSAATWGRFDRLEQMLKRNPSIVSAQKLAQVPETQYITF